LPDIDHGSVKKEPVTVYENQRANDCALPPKEAVTYIFLGFCHEIKLSTYDTAS
jgi:hypothetical protein